MSGALVVQSRPETSNLNAKFADCANSLVCRVSLFVAGLLFAGGAVAAHFYLGAGAMIAFATVGGISLVAFTALCIRSAMRSKSRDVAPPPNASTPLTSPTPANTPPDSSGLGNGVPNESTATSYAPPPQEMDYTGMNLPALLLHLPDKQPHLDSRFRFTFLSGCPESEREKVAEAIHPDLHEAFHTKLQAACKEIAAGTQDITCLGLHQVEGRDLLTRAAWIANAMLKWMSPWQVAQWWETHFRDAHGGLAVFLTHDLPKVIANYCYDSENNGRASYWEFNKNSLVPKLAIVSLNADALFGDWSKFTSGTRGIENAGPDIAEDSLQEEFQQCGPEGKIPDILAQALHELIRHIGINKLESGEKFSLWLQREHTPLTPDQVEPFFSMFTNAQVAFVYLACDRPKQGDDQAAAEKLGRLLGDGWKLQTWDILQVRDFTVSLERQTDPANATETQEMEEDEESWDAGSVSGSSSSSDGEID